MHMQLFQALPTLGFLFLGGLFGGIFSLLCAILWIWALVDCLSTGALVGTTKLIWVLVIIFVPLLGPILYFLLGKGGSTRPLV